MRLRGRRTLVLRPGAIGDFILSIPAMESLRDGYLEVWAAGQNLPLARFADAAFSLASTGIDLLGVGDLPRPPRLIERLRSFDRIVSWYGANREEFRAACQGLPIEFFPALPDGGHAADFYLRQAGGSGPAVPRIPCDAAKENFAVIHPFASSPAKRWPMERFEVLASLLAPQLTALWCAGPDEPLAGAVRIDDLYELACWLARARIYIGNDSGIAHLAAAAGTPVIALFGPTDPAMWSPRGDRIRVIERMHEVEPRQVLEAAQAIW